jgi:hypothetical protein
LQGGESHKHTNDIGHCWTPLTPACHLKQFSSWHLMHLRYSLRFKIKVTFGHKLRYEIKVRFGEVSLKLRQTNWNTARNNVDIVVDELPS